MVVAVDSDKKREMGKISLLNRLFSNRYICKKDLSFGRVLISLSTDSSHIGTEKFTFGAAVGTENDSLFTFSNLDRNTPYQD